MSESFKNNSEIIPEEKVIGLKWTGVMTSSLFQAIHKQINSIRKIDTGKVVSSMNLAISIAVDNLFPNLKEEDKINIRNAYDEKLKMTDFKSLAAGEKPVEE